MAETRNAESKTRDFLIEISKKYDLEGLKSEISKDDSLLYKKDVYISLVSIIDVLQNDTIDNNDKIEQLKSAKNIYNGSIFSLDFEGKNHLIKNIPVLNTVISKLGDYDSCFNMNIYSIVNTVLAIITAEICGFNLNDLLQNGKKHVQNFIDYSLKTNDNWDEKTLKTDNPKLIIPIGAAGCGKSTFYKELSNVLSLSCDNIRYLLFKDFGPCFSPWESTLSWWVVNYLTDYYLNNGYSVFYNGVNTDIEYRTPMSMEIDDPIYKGLKYNIVIVFFEPPVQLTESELEELKSIDLWKNDIESLDMSNTSENVKKIIVLIKDNYKRTLNRTEKIRSGELTQDEFDILYSVPAPIVKLFVEQNFNMPTSENVIKVPRKHIPDAVERSNFYKSYAELIMV